MGLRLAERHGREEDICKGVHGGASQSLKPLVAAGVVKEGRGLRGKGEGLGEGGRCAGQRGKPAKALMVMPPRAEAAKPVDAVTKVESLGKARRMCFSSSDLPVPAQPVKKTLWPSLQWRTNIVI